MGVMEVTFKNGTDGDYTAVNKQDFENRVTYRLQSGYLYSYAFVMLLGLIGAASWAIWWAAK